MTLFTSITLLCGTNDISRNVIHIQTECGEYPWIFCGILSIPKNIVMDLSNVMTRGCECTLKWEVYCKRKRVKTWINPPKLVHMLTTIKNCSPQWFSQLVCIAIRSYPMLKLFKPELFKPSYSIFMTISIMPQILIGGNFAIICYVNDKWATSKLLGFFEQIHMKSVILKVGGPHEVILVDFPFSWSNTRIVGPRTHFPFDTSNQ